MVDYKKIEVVRGGSEDNDFSPRYIIIDKETGEVLDDAQGYGYKTKWNAYACFGYKNRDKSKDVEKEYKKRCVKRFCKANRAFISLLEQVEFEICVGKWGPNDVFNTKLVKKIFDENGYKELEFTIPEFLKYWERD